jgi:hypothetical protein
MVWSGYVQEAHERGIIEHTTPTSPTKKRAPKKDPRTLLTTEEAIDLYDTVKEVLYDTNYDNMILDNWEFNSFSVENYVNTKATRGYIDSDFRAWCKTYHDVVWILYDTFNQFFALNGKRIALKEKVFIKFVYVNSSKYLSNNT